MKSNLIISFIFCFGSCSKQSFNGGLFVNNNKKIIIYNDKVNIISNDTLLTYNYKKLESSSKFLFLESNDTLEKLNIEFKDTYINYLYDSILLIFDDDIVNCKCYFLGKDISPYEDSLGFNLISKKFIMIQKTKYFYLFSNFKRPFSRYIMSEKKLTNNRNVFYISTHEQKNPLKYYNSTLYGIEILGKTKIRYLNELYFKE